MMVDAHRYETLFFIHRPDDHYMDDSDSYEDLEDAIASAKDSALEQACNYEVTEVLTRVAAQITIDVIVDKL